MLDNLQMKTITLPIHFSKFMNSSNFYTIIIEIVIGESLVQATLFRRGMLRDVRAAAYPSLCKLTRLRKYYCHHRAGTQH